MQFDFKKELSVITSKYEELNDLREKLEVKLLNISRKALEDNYPNVKFELTYSYGFHPDESDIDYLDDLHIIMESIDAMIYLDNGKSYIYRYVKDKSKEDTIDDFNYISEVHYDEPKIELAELQYFISTTGLPIKVRVDKIERVKNSFSREY